MSKKVVSLECSQGHYVADACIFWCLDDRLWKLRKNSIKELGFKNIDCVQVAGPCKDLAGEDRGAREFLLKQIGISIELHGCKRVVLVIHIDCGACGGSKAFKDIDDEWTHHVWTLARAAEVVQNRFPQIPIDKYVADFEGLHHILPQW